MRGWIVVALFVASCGKGKPATQRSSEQDALWKLAPLTATSGIVISKQGLLALESTWRELDKALDGSPELVAIAAVLRQERPALFPDGEPSLARAGLTADRGAAWFFSRSGARIAFLPVSDRAAFLAFMNGMTAEDGDHIGNLTCKTVGDRYACAMPPELLGRIGGGTLGEQVKLAGTRGDLELAIEDGDAHVRAGAVAELEHGSIVVRGAIRAHELKGKVVNAQAQRFDPGKLAGFGVLNVGAALASLPIPREPVAAGLTLADLIGDMTGPILLSLPPGVRQAEVRVPMKSPTIATALVTHCEDIPHLAILSSTFSSGVCHLTVPGISMELDVSVEGSELRARTKSAAVAPATLRPTAIARELATGQWAYGVYGRGTMLGSFQPGSEPIPFESALGLRALSWLSEGGVGVRTDGDLVRFFIGIRTVWSNPDPLVAKWLGLPVEQMIAPTALETARQIAATEPTAPLGDDLNAGTAVLVPVAALALVAGFASPQLLDAADMRDLGIGESPVASPAEALAKMTTFKDAMCACKDVACAKRVTDEMTAWTMDEARKGYKPPRLSPAEQATATTIGNEMGACLQAAYGSGTPSRASEYITKNIELRERLCACKDVACGEAVSRETTTWSEEFVKNLPRGTTMSAADDQRMQTIETEAHACMKALRAGHK